MNIALSIASLIFFAVLLCGCSMIIEQGVENIPRASIEPKFAEVVDSTQIVIVKSAIQADKETILANAVEFYAGKYSLSLSLEEAEALGIDSKLFKRYQDMVENLNSLQ